MMKRIFAIFLCVLCLSGCVEKPKEAAFPNGDNSVCMVRVFYPIDAAALIVQGKKKSLQKEPFSVDAFHADPTGRVKAVVCSGYTFSGEEMAAAFRLPATCFTMEVKGDMVVFQVEASSA